MRRVAWALLLLFVFAIPWEYSLDLGEPFGNVARILGLLLLLVAIPAVLQAGKARTPGPMQALVLALFLWLCCTYFWTIDSAATLGKMRAYFQEMMIVLLVWEFVENPADLRDLLRTYVAGSWVLAALTLANFGSPEAIAAGQMRFVAYGQDPNDVARFLDLGFPLAGLLLTQERGWPARLLAGAFARAPLFGSGAGTFVSAAGLSPIDTAHNTALSILVAGGLCALFLAAGIVALAVLAVLETRGALRATLATALLVWIVTSLVATVEESRTTWLLLALISVAGRFAVETPEELARCFSTSAGPTPHERGRGFVPQPNL